MERMITSIKDSRAKERLQDYQETKMSEWNAQDSAGATDVVVDQILQEVAEDSERRDKVQAQADLFYQYEAQQKHRQKDSGKIDNLPQDDTDLDNWALERLEEMLETSQNREDDDGSIPDILE
jgi:hypothetical protein